MELSRRNFAIALVGTTALAACSSTGGSLSATASAFLTTVASTLLSVANGLSGTLSQLANIGVSINIPAATVGTIQGGLNSLSQIAASIVTASNTTASTLLQKAYTYINDIVAAGGSILSIPGISALPFAGQLSTAFRIAGYALPYVEQGINYLVALVAGQPAVPPSTTAPLVPATSSPTAAAAMRRFGAAPPMTIVQVTAYLNSVAKAP